MLALLLILAGLCLMVGARDLAGRLFRAVAVAVLVFALAPAVLTCISRFGPIGDGRHGGSYLLPAVVLGIGLVGFIAWRTRAHRERGRESHGRRHGAPRERALPSPPRDKENDL